VNHLATAFIVFFTISLGMAVGVGSGYLIIAGILNLFARKPKDSKPAPSLAAQGVAGD
jgi:hypothetical protein